MDSITGICLFVVAVLAGAVAYIFLSFRASTRKLLQHVSDLDAAVRVRVEEVHVPPLPLEMPVEDVPSEVDIAGAWALEQARYGRVPSEREVEMQRRMWAEEGSF